MWTEETVSLADVEEVIGDLNQQVSGIEMAKKKKAKRTCSSNFEL